MTRARPEDGIAWVTGASAGIGRALALKLAGQGYRVAATARRADALAALAAEEPHIVAYCGDVTEPARMAKIIGRIEREQGPIALAVLNAGVYEPAERDGFERARVWRTIEGNLGGTVACLDPLLPAMLARGRGQIAIVASLAGYGGIPGSLAYGAAKAAMITMAEALALTYSDAGLTIQVVNPGFVRTAMTAKKRLHDAVHDEPRGGRSAHCRRARARRLRGGLSASAGVAHEAGGAAALRSVAAVDSAGNEARPLTRLQSGVIWIDRFQAPDLMRQIVQKVW